MAGRKKRKTETRLAPRWHTCEASGMSRHDKTRHSEKMIQHNQSPGPAGAGDGVMTHLKKISVNLQSSCSIGMMIPCQNCRRQCMRDSFLQTINKLYREEAWWLVEGIRELFL